MRPGFQRDPTARHCAKDCLQRFRIRTDSLLQLYLACFIHHAVPAVAISQIQSDGQFLLRNIPARLHGCGANLLHCRSPFYLCLEHVDNLGAYTASRPETGLLIPSDYNSYFRFARDTTGTVTSFANAVSSTPTLPHCSIYRSGQVTRGMAVLAAIMAGRVRAPV